MRVIGSKSSSSSISPAKLTLINQQANALVFISRDLHTTFFVSGARFHAIAHGQRMWYTFSSSIMPVLSNIPLD